MIVLIDNYDSFTYNLVQYFGALGADVQVHRNDKISVDAVFKLKPQGIIISPGPSDPDHAGICMPTIKEAAARNVPLFGVCLGLQCMGQVFGGDVVRAPVPMHGKISRIAHSGESVFKNVPSPCPVTRYHSLMVAKESLPDCLAITSESDDGVIMGLMHKTAPLHSVQFHPESIATENGMQMLKNFVALL